MSRDNLAQATGIEIIQDPLAIQKLYNSLVQSAKREILLLLPTTSAFLREEKMGIIQSLHNAANPGVKIKVLTPTDEKIVPKMEAVLQDKNNNMGIRRVRYKSEAETTEEARTNI